MISMHNSSLDKFLFLNKVNIVLALTVIFFHLNITPYYRETFLLTSGAFLIVISGAWSAMSYIGNAHREYVDFITRDKKSKFVHIRIPYFLTLVGLVAYLSALSSSLCWALIAGIICAGLAQNYSKIRERKIREQLNKTY